MKKLTLTCLLSACAMGAFAQLADTPELIFDPNEDPEQVVTIAEVAKLQEKVTTQTSRSNHFDKVWGRKSFFNLSYLTSAELKPKFDTPLGYPAINGDKVPDFKAEYGVALQLGRCYNLHKKPIANTVMINLDYSYIDLSAAYYKKYDSEFVYDSNNKWEETVDKTQNEERQYIPWCLSKYDISYGMTLGPSITVAPFNYINVQQLHFVKLNFYYHIGYQVGILWLQNDKEADAAGDSESNYYYSDPLKINWEHGLMQTFGVNLSWKTIGVGFESRTDQRAYKAFDTSTYGSKTYKFSGTSARVYLRICY